MPSSLVITLFSAVAPSAALAVLRRDLAATEEGSSSASSSSSPAVLDRFLFLDPVAVEVDCWARAAGVCSVVLRAVDAAEAG